MPVFKTILISEARPAEIRQFAELMGVDIEDTDGPAAVLSKLSQVYQGEAIRLPEAGPAHDMTGAPPPAPASFGDDPVATALDAVVINAGTSYRDDPRVKLIIANEERDGVITSSDVNVGVNTVVTQLRRGVVLDVPYRVFLALAQAKRNVVTMNDQGDIVEVEAPSYPFSVQEMPDRAEIREWHARVDHVELA